MNTKIFPRSIIIAISAALILLLAALYFVLLNEKTKSVTAESNNASTNVASNVTNNTPIKTRDPNRFYNDRDGYSITVPKGYIAKTADNVYEPGSIAADEHALMIDEKIPESLKLGGSDWIPQVGIYTSEKKSNRDISEYTKVTINGYNFLKLVSIQPKDQFWFEGEVYTYLLQTDTKDYVITGRTKAAVEATVNSFELL